MVDQGLINEAENILLENMDYTRKDDIFAAIIFYKYVSEKTDDFLASCNYSKKEALDGLAMLAEKSGYGEVNRIFEAGDEY